MALTPAELETKVLAQEGEIAALKTRVDALAPVPELALGPAPGAGPTVEFRMGKRAWSAPGSTTAELVEQMKAAGAPAEAIAEAERQALTKAEWDDEAGLVSLEAPK